MINKPYLLFLGDAPDPYAIKVARGIRDWRPEEVVGQLSLPECQTTLELDELTVSQAIERGAQTMVIGLANRGGVISENWKPIIIEALEAGMDIAAGLHQLLANDPDIATAAKSLGRQLHDVRIPQETYPIANGVKRTGKRLLTVGTDCSVGKMYTTLAMEKSLSELGVSATFRATGQTGIMISGAGVPLDAVVADFMAGVIEHLTPDNEPDHWDLIEGQGSLFHASFSGVTLALIHGSQPDALVLCHEPHRPHMRGLPDYALPSLASLEELATTMASIVNPECRVIGIALNTASMSESEANEYCQQIEAEMSLPTVDPYRHGAHRLAEAVAAL